MAKKYFSSEEMYAFDDYTINEIGIPSSVLMERAAHATVLDLQKKISKEATIVVVAGSGHNGGDAIAVARMLYLLGYHLELFVLGKDNYSEGMKQQLTIAQNVQLPISYKIDTNRLKSADFIIEGIFGIGLSREIEGKFKHIVDLINQARENKTTIIALDIPSGLSAVTGKPFKNIVHADYTYTFGFYKTGMDTDLGKKICGEIILCDIGYPVKAFLDANLI